jgi:cytochrome c556
MRKQFVLTSAALYLAFATCSAHAAEPLELQRVMKELGKHMQTVTDGISREDWDTVARTAPLIAEHPQPPLTEKMRIMAFMGSDMSRFKAFDGKTHEAAEEMAKSAREKNGQKVIDSFHKLQSACLSCHQTFRAPFVAHFYGNTGD